MHKNEDRQITDMTEQVTSALARGINYLLTLQHDDGRFEGQLSASTFPSCAYAWIQLVQGETPSSEQIAWFINTQNEEGAFGLDTSKRSNPNATLFSKLILEQISESSSQLQLQDMLSKIPHQPIDLALLKLAYATFGRFDWHKLSISKKALPLMNVIKILKRIPVFRSLLKPPRHKLPPVDLFNTPLFQDLFIAEQHTLVPVFILIELNTSNRQDILESLVVWLESKVLSDGSWFRVNYITTLSVLALIEVKKHGNSNSHITDLIQNGIQWLKSTQNPDGGYREALNLNVWDTALSVIALTEVDPDYITHTDAIENAVQWLVDHQNEDGGWAFSGMQDSALPSDADDTALATLAIIRSEQQSRKKNSAIDQGIAWLIQNHGEDGSWSTYQPGQGDVGCVSITAHAIEALLTYPENSEVILQVADGVEWLRAAIHNDGYWDDLWLAKRTYGTASALIALARTDTSDVSEMREGVKWLENSQHPDGGWGEDMFGNPTHSTIEQTAWSTYALLLTSAVNPTIQKGIDYLIRQQRGNGSWQESCVGIYWEVIGGYSDPIYASVFPILALNQYLKQTE